MKNPDPYAPEEYIEELDNYDEFKRLFNEKYDALDEARAKESFKTNFEGSEKLEHRLFNDVVDAFSDKNAAEGSDSGFETRIVNPLYEFSENTSEILLANMTPSGVHLCFVSPHVGGEDSKTWLQEINETCSLMQKDSVRRHLKRHIECNGLTINTVQYLTFTRDIDLIDVDCDVMKVGTNPDNYAIWKLITEQLELEDGDTVEDREISLHDGHIEHPELAKLARKGVDPTIADNDDIKYSLDSHPIFPIGEVLLDIYLKRYPSGEFQKEFNESEFEQSYKSMIYLGNERSRIKTVVDETIESLLETACEYEMIEDNPDAVEERDYKILWQSEDPGDIKDMVKEKFFNEKAPEQRGKLAFKRAKEQYSRTSADVTDY